MNIFENTIIKNIKYGGLAKQGSYLFRWLKDDIILNSIKKFQDKENACTVEYMFVDFFDYEFIITLSCTDKYELPCTVDETVKDKLHDIFLEELKEYPEFII